MSKDSTKVNVGYEKISNIWDRQREEKSQKTRFRYEASPKHCGQCGCALPYEKRHYHRFCTVSCAAKYNNQRRVERQVRQEKPCAWCKLDFSGKNKYCPPCIAKGNHIPHKIRSFSDLKSPGSIRKLLLRLRPHQCQNCLLTEWQGQPIPLDMEHVDGNSDNNKEINLKLLCPNCHAQTPTYKGKNIGKGRHTRRIRYSSGLSY